MISINEDLIETSNSGGISINNVNAVANVDFNRKLNLLKQLKITFESIMFNYGLNSPNIWQQITTLMNIFAKNIHSILEDDIIDELNIDESSISNRTQSFSMPYELENINYKQRSFKNQRLWSFISTCLQPDTNNNNNKFKMIQKQLNGQLNSDVIQLINDWILISLKSCTLLEQLKQLFNENNQKSMSIYYKKSSFLFDKQLLNDFFLYINAYETRDYSLLDQQNVNVNGYFGDLEATNRCDQQQYLDAKTHKIQHRRMHSCPIVDKQSGSGAQTTITGSSIEDNLMTINVKANDNEQSEEAIGKESADDAVTVNDADSDENESINNESTNLNDLIYSKTSILDYIHSQQLYYDRSLLDKENSHFYIAELTLSTIELMKNEDKLSANPVGMEDNYIRKFHMRSTLPRQIPSSTTSWLGATCDSITSSTYDLSMSPLSISQSHSASQPIYMDQLSPKQMSIDGGDLDFRTESTSSSDTTTTVSTQQETMSSRETPASFLTTTTSGIGDSLSIQIDRSRSPSPSSVTRRYSWEYSNNERTINAESLSKLMIKSYLNKKQSNKNRPAPTLIDYKHIIETSNYAEFTQFFLKQAQSSTSSSTTTTNDFSNTSTQLTSSQKLEFNNQEARIIGDNYWAPVREQLILNANKVKLKRLLQMKQQYFRCADCGYKINDENKIKTFRYCEYFCKYFCRCCHSKQQSYIPSYIIYSSDYRQTYYVCKKAKHFLDKIYHEPLITLEDLNPKLFESQSSSIFYRIKQLRMKLYNCKRYIHSCRLAIGLKQQLEDNFVDFLYNDTRVYSISTLYAFKKEDLYDKLKSIVQSIIDHIRKCEICSQQGYICELCNKSQELLYPFDIDYVSKCPNCLACYHRNCFNVNKPEQCPRCKRKKLRNKSVTDQQQQKSNSIDSSSIN